MLVNTILSCGRLRTLRQPVTRFHKGYARILKARRAGRRKDPTGQDIAARRFEEDRKFLELRKKWYAKLKRKGFRDVELTDWETGRHRERMNGISQADVVNTYSPEQERYYQLAVHWVQVMRLRRKKRLAARLGLPPTTAEEVRVWEMHANGRYSRQIAKAIKRSRGPGDAVIKREKALMLAFDWESHADLLDEALGNVTLPCERLGEA